jgi:hypothetical protein
LRNYYSEIFDEKNSKGLYFLWDTDNGINEETGIQMEFLKQQYFFQTNI